MKRRETTLAAVSGGLLLLLLAVFFLSGGGRSAKQLRAARDQLCKDVEEKKLRARPGQRAVAQLAEWEKRSLPSDHGIARSLYQDWLRNLVVAVKLSQAKVEPGEGQSRRGAYTMLPFTIRGRGSLDQLTQFLFKFYSAGHLHKLRRLTITPLENSQQLDLVISIEALSLPGTDRSDELASAPTPRPASAKLDDYRQAIVRRLMEDDRFLTSGGLFAAYEPPPRPPSAVDPDPPPPSEPEPEPPGFDATRHTYLTGVVEVDGKAQAWLKVRTSGEIHRLHEGEPFEIGEVDGTVVAIDVRQREIEVEIDGHRRLVAFDESLAEGTELPQE